MAVYVLSNTGGLISAGEAGDSITTQSPALGGATILGNGGNDTITTLATNNASAAGYQVKGGAGADSISIASGVFSAGEITVFGGAGNDSIDITGGKAASLKTQGGADIVSADGATITTLAVGAGNDSVLITGTITNLGLGGGKDQLTGSLTLATGASIKLGDGADTINLVLSGQGTGAIYGDQQATSAGADKITVETVGIAGVSIKGAGGNDTITITSAGASAFIAGNAGADSITVSGVIQDNLTIRGGGGNDTVEIFTGAVLNGKSALVALGEGADSLTLDGALTTGQNASSFIVAGGAGADSITFSGAQTTGNNITIGTLSFSSFSDSNLAATDVVDVNAVAGVSGELHFDFNQSATVDAVTNLSALVMFNSNTNYATLSTGGVVSFNGSLAVSSVTASMATVDTLTLSDGVGASAIFKTAGGASYLFMQGGTSGTDDDGLVKLVQASGGSLHTSDNSAVTVVFKGLL